MKSNKSNECETVPFWESDNPLIKSVTVGLVDGCPPERLIVSSQLFFACFRAWRWRNGETAGPHYPGYHSVPGPSATAGPAQSLGYSIPHLQRSEVRGDDGASRSKLTSTHPFCPATRNPQPYNHTLAGRQLSSVRKSTALRHGGPSRGHSEAGEGDRVDADGGWRRWRDRATRAAAPDSLAAVERGGGRGQGLAGRHRGGAAERDTDGTRAAGEPPGCGGAGDHLQAWRAHLTLHHRRPARLVAQQQELARVQRAGALRDSAAAGRAVRRAWSRDGVAVPGRRVAAHQADQAARAGPGPRRGMGRAGASLPGDGRRAQGGAGGRDQEPEAEYGRARRGGRAASGVPTCRAGPRSPRGGSLVR
eukprot:scaffold9324_cov115-Isochrysis_galbana.AAC.2